MRTALIALAGTAFAATIAAQQAPVIGLITKTETNPFFVKMKEGAQQAATAKGGKLLTGAGKTDGDNAGQVTAMENMINAGAKTILITPSDSKAILPAIAKARAKGVQVIALDSPTDPADGTDALFATDNYKGRRADRRIRQGGARRQAGQGDHARPVPRPPGRRAAAQRLPQGLRPQRAGCQEQRARQAGRSGLHGRQLRRPGQGPDRHGELPAEERRGQRGLHHQRAGPQPVPTRH